MTKQSIDVCVISDDAYTIPTTVMLTSAKLNKKAESAYRIHLISRGISDFHKKKISELASADFEIKFYDVNLDKYASVQQKTHVSLAALLKFDLPDILKSIDQALYLDGDILVRGDLTDFCSIKLQNNLIAAVRDFGAEQGMHFNDMVGCKEYFNSGVLWMNLARMRELDIPDKLLHVKLNAPPEWVCADQDTLNSVCCKECVYLPVRYNAMIPLFKGPASRHNYAIEQLNEFYGTTYCNYEEMNDDALIIHFAGESLERPWLYLNGSFSMIWQKYYNASPFGEIDLPRSLNPAHKYHLIRSANRVVFKSLIKEFIILIKIQHIRCTYLFNKLMSFLTFGKIYLNYKSKTKSLQSRLKEAIDRAQNF